MSLLLVEPETFDFHDSNGQVPAHQHPNGLGWVAETAYVSSTAYLGRNALVSENAQVGGYAVVSENAQVYGDQVGMN